MDKSLSEYLRSVVGDLAKKYLDQELDKLIVLGKINSKDKEKIVHKVEFKSLSSNIENICATYQGKPKPTKKGEILASEFNVMYEVEDALKEWNEKSLQPVINTVVNGEKRG